MKKIISIITFLFLILQITGCDFIDNKLAVHNNTDSTIAFLIPQEPNYFPTGGEPDNITCRQRNDSLLDTKVKMPIAELEGGVHFVSAHAVQHVRTFNTTWEGVIKKSPSQKLEFFFFPAGLFTLGKYTWREIRSMYLQKKAFTKADLKKVDWVVDFDKE